jgi:hypothetical protein
MSWVTLSTTDVRDNLNDAEFEEYRRHVGPDQADPMTSILAPSFTTSSPEPRPPTFRDDPVICQSVPPPSMVASPRAVAFTPRAPEVL